MNSGCDGKRNDDMREGFKEIPPQESASEQDVDRYISEHRDELAWKDVDMAKRWGLINVLPYFETQCDLLRRSGSPDLYRTRQLTHFIDKNVHSGGRVNATKKEVSLLLLDRASEKFRLAPKADSIEYQEAKAEYDHDVAATTAYEKQDVIEPTLAMIEEAAAALDHDIDLMSRTQNNDPRDERKNRSETKTLEDKRKLFRRARIFLLNEYFPK